MSVRRLITRDNSTPYARVGGRSIETAEFCADVLACAESLPDARHLINLCTERYAFSVVFFAALVRGQTNLLPAQRSRQALDALTGSTERCAVVTNDATVEADALVELRPGTNGQASSPTIDRNLTALVAFTYGTTGSPQPHAKSWGLLANARDIHRRYLSKVLPQAGLNHQEHSLGLVATVPSWHMYGLEWALLLPTVAPVTLHCGADFFPSDVTSALDAFAEPGILVATPLHLRALLKVPSPSQPVAVTISATAPLDTALSSSVESHLRSRLFEIYGCSEIGSLAWRCPTQLPDWDFFDSFEIEYTDHQVCVRSSFLREPIQLADRFEQRDGNLYELLGRAGDIVKVGGKRASLTHLNRILLSVTGVEDGVFYEPANFGLPNTERLGALVVAPSLSANDIRSALAAKLDPAFVPRPLRVVEMLPRESTSKLSIAALGRLIAERNVGN
jgi:acyl-coenzyme A synthetase/AMP-(fatty) acid ligase